MGMLAPRECGREEMGGKEMGQKELLQICKVEKEEGVVSQNLLLGPLLGWIPKERKSGHAFETLRNTKLRIYVGW